MKILHDEDYARFVGVQESQFILKASDLTSKLKDRISLGVDGFGDQLPWERTHTQIRFRPGEVSVWAGINGHGKSLVLGQAMLWMLPDTKVLIASMEMKPEATMERMVKQASGGPEPTFRFIDTFMTWTDDRLWIYDQLDTVESERILGMIHYAAVELQVKHIVIDSLMKCGIGTDNYNGQKEFVDALCFAAKRHDIHVHLVHHMRKRDKEESMPDKFDVRGASEIVDLVDNLIIVHRNKKKERMLEAGENVSDTFPDAVLGIAKQRHGEWEGRIALWFHKGSQQYTARSIGGVMPWPSPNVSIYEVI